MELSSETLLEYLGFENIKYPEKNKYPVAYGDPDIQYTSPEYIYEIVLTDKSKTCYSRRI